MGVRPEIAKVYRSTNGKRYFTLRASITNDVIRRLLRKTDKDGAYDELVGREHHQSEFYTEEQWIRFRSTAQRYYRRYSRAIRALHIEETR